MKRSPNRSIMCATRSISVASRPTPIICIRPILHEPSFCSRQLLLDARGVGPGAPLPADGGGCATRVYIETTGVTVARRAAKARALHRGGRGTGFLGQPSARTPDRHHP